jgi:mannose-1-phosphate guanylyltransferase
VFNSDVICEYPLD